MKKQLFGLAVCGCVLLSTSCSNDELVNVITPEQNIEPTYVTASVGADTRLSFDDSEIGTSLKVNWRNEAETNPEIFYGAGFTEGKGLKFTQTGTLVGKESQFLVEGYTSAWGNDALTDGNTYHLLYPAKSTYASSFEVAAGLSSVEVALSLEGQTGKLADLENYNYMTCVATRADGDLDIKFANRISIIHLEKGMQFTGITAATTATEISLSGACIFSSATLNMSGSTADISFGDTPADIVTTGSFAIDAEGKLTEPVYIAFLPNAATTGEALTITAKVGSNTYKLEKGSTPTFNQGQLYTLNGSMTKVGANAKFEAMLADFSKSMTLPTSDIWVIKDVNGIKNDAANLKSVLGSAKAAGRKIALEFPNMTTAEADFLYKAYGCVSIDMPLLTTYLNRTIGGESGTPFELEYVNLPKLSNIGSRFMQNCGTVIKTLIVGTEVDGILEVDTSNFFSGTSLTNTDLYINAAENEANVSDKKWRSKGPFATVNVGNPQ